MNLDDPANEHFPDYVDRTRLVNVPDNHEFERDVVYVFAQVAEVVVLAVRFSFSIGRPVHIETLVLPAAEEEVEEGN